MSGVRHDHGHSEPETVPPFWLPADVCGARAIDEQVLKVSEANWSWAFWLTARELHDGARTRDIVVDAAVEVSDRLKADPEVGRNLNGYLRTTIIRMLKMIAIRESRITYEGGTYDLEFNHRPQAADWNEALDDRLILQALIPYMSHPVQHILHLRQADYSWKYIARRLSLTEKQVKSRFYYGAHRAYEELLKVQEQRARETQKHEDERGSG
jgi:DNA-directed RNA polymerase specialized sigma24 family protein